ncbi:MAG TPA: TraB/GumN family protein [Bdellovibrionales bacterium]|nr:TraB/GumN family protein [Bdellovibrionales bacterium]
MYQQKLSKLIFLILVGVSKFAYADSVRAVDPHLYALEKNGSVSYVLGTIHVGVDISEMPDFVTNALKEKPIFASEALDSERKPKGEDRFSLLSLETQRLLQLRGMTKEDFNTYRPEAVCMAYLYWDFLDKNPDNGEVMDWQFDRLAKGAHKELRELDVSDALIDEAVEQLFSPCGIEAFVEKYPPLAVGPMVKESMQPSNDEYKYGGEISLNNGTNAEESTLKRNELWVPLLMDMHAKGLFAVVGAGHLDPYNPRGLLSLLKKNGFQVTRISDRKTYLEVSSRYQN